MHGVPFTGGGGFSGNGTMPMMVVLSSTTADLSHLMVGDIVRFDVSLTGLNPGDTLDYLGADLSFPGGLFDPLPTVSAGVVPTGISMGLPEMPSTAPTSRIDRFS